MGKVLKILSGMHLGAQAELPPQGTLTMGRGEDCDLILDDLLAADEHVRLTTGPEPGSVSISFLSPGFVGERLAPAGHSQALTDWEVVTFGATQFCVGPGDAPWKTPPLPDWQKLQALAREEEARRTGTATDAAPDGAPEEGAAETADAGTSTETPATESTANNGNGPEEQTASPEEAQTGAPGGGNDATPPLSDHAGGRRHRLVLAAVAGLFLLAFAPAWFFIPGTGEAPLSGKTASGTGNGSGGEELPSDPEVLRRMIDEICARYGLTRTDSGGKWVISGIVRDTSAAQAIRDELRNGVGKVELRLFSRQQLLRAAQAVIKGFGYPVSVSVADDGVVSLKGSVPDSREMSLVLSRMQSDVPGARRFDLDLELLSQVNDTLTSELTALGLDGVKMKLESAVLRSEGIVPAEKQTAWRQALESWKSRFPYSIQSIEDRTRVEEAAPEPPAPQAVAVATETSAPLPSPIASIRLRPLPSFQTRDGSVYFDKAPLGNGYLVDGIELTGVWIRPARQDGESERSWIGLGQAAPTGWN